MSKAKRLVGVSAAAAMCLASGVGAQQPAPLGGTVTGHVTLSDTQRPARFATVLLFEVPATVTPASAPAADAKDDAQALAALKAGLAAFNGASLVQTETDEEGAFTAAGVAPGDYYVFAAVPGYLQPVNQVKAALEAGADPAKPLPGVLVVHVAAARESTADVAIDRGAAVSGRVVWEDGSPVTKAVVTVAAAKGEKPLPPQYSMVVVGSALAGGIVAITDDLGRFRIAGLAPGEYYVKAAVQTKSQFSMQKGKMNFNLSQAAADKPLTVFAPAGFHQGDGKAVTLAAGQDSEGEDIAIHLGNLHSVSGRMASATDHHGINSGTVSLVDASDKDFSRSASVNEDGTFAIKFVPPGSYTLKAEDAADTVPSTKPANAKGLVNLSSDERVKSYEDATQPVIVADDDVTGQSVELAPSATVKKGVDLGGLLSGLLENGDASAPPPPPAQKP